MISSNGTLTNDPAHGWVWTTQCRKCDTRQRIRIGHITPEEAADAVSQINDLPQECPLGFHVELGGWKTFWSLDLMLDQYANQKGLT